MTDVLVVAADKLCDPIAFVICVISGDRLLHQKTLRNGIMGFVDSISGGRLTGHGSQRRFARLRNRGVSQEIHSADSCTLTYRMVFYTFW